jgi:hypothetical protein
MVFVLALGYITTPNWRKLGGRVWSFFNHNIFNRGFCSEKRGTIKIITVNRTYKKKREEVEIYAIY